MTAGFVVEVIDAPGGRGHQWLTRCSSCTFVAVSVTADMATLEGRWHLGRAHPRQ